MMAGHKPASFTNKYIKRQYGIQYRIYPFYISGTY